MNTAKSISAIFKVNAAEFGKYDAVSATTTVVGIAIYRLLEDGLEVNEKNLAEKITELAQDYIEMSKSDVA